MSLKNMNSSNISTPIKVAVLPQFGAFELKESNDGRTTVTGGFDSEFLKMVFQALNIPYEVGVPKELNWGFQTGDGNWTGLVGMVSRGEADIAFGGVLLTETRLEVVDYIYPYKFVQMPFATRQPEAIFHSLTFIYTFSRHLWMCIIAFLICLSFILMYVFPDNYSFEALAFKILKLVLNQDVSFRISKLSDRLIVGTMLLGVFLLSVSYSSVLLAFLTLPVQEKAVKEIETLTNAVKNGEMKVYLLQESSLRQILMDHPDDRVKYLIEEINKNHWFLKPDVGTLQKSFFKGKNAFIASYDTFGDFLESDSFVVSDDVFCGFLQAVILTKNSRLKRKVDRIMNRIVASGIYDKNVKDYFFRKAYNRKVPRKNLEMSLTLQKMKGVLIVLLIGYLISITVFLTEVCIFNQKNKRKYQKSV